MSNIDYVQQIIEKLKPLNPHKVILFGSHAYGTATKDSDIDLLVVTNDDVMPKNFRENMGFYLKVARTLSEIKRKIPVDLIVHTIPMHERFIELGSMFSKEILSKGKILYEKDYERVV
jgi:predicted nucleotidyltransferase